jgi:ankyrin repeat protein
VGGEALILHASVHGFSCIHTASQRGHVLIVAYLLSLPSCSALVGLRDSYGRTALELAVASGQEGAAAAMRAALGRRGAR